jgi:hypothetical protein
MKNNTLQEKIDVMKRFLIFAVGVILVNTEFLRQNFCIFPIQRQRAYNCMFNSVFSPGALCLLGLAA